MPSPPSMWVIDTSSIIHVREMIPATDRQSVFDGLTAQAEAGLLVFPAQVFDELKRHYDPRRNDPPYRWVERNRATAVRPVDFQIVREVMERAVHRSTSGELVTVVDLLKPDEEADPYVASLGLMLKRDGFDVRIITEDRFDKPYKLSLTTACGMLGLPVIPLMVHLDTSRLWPARGTGTGS